MLGECVAALRSLQFHNNSLGSLHGLVCYPVCDLLVADRIVLQRLSATGGERQ
jgi:hypothetical protein